MNYGTMNFKDVANISIFLDLAARYLLDNQKSLTELSKSQGSINF